MKYYLTTPIYYVNAAPHIGTAYTTMVADTIKRYKTMCGYDVVLTTGTDEHGQKIERAAQNSNRTPKEFTDAVSNEFRSTWEQMHLAIDHFKRTTDPDHERNVQALYEACKANGYIYKGGYTGQYCVSDELYVNEAKPGDPCPTCGRVTETVTEENLYFKLSAFQERLVELHERDPLFIQPDTRRNEVLAFLKQGLTDLSISRTTIKWGIPVPDEPAHVFYVWFDALMTYMSAVWNQDAGNQEKPGEKIWPADLHLIGKEIVRFHAIYWPAFLMAANWPLPKRIYAHGWLLFDNDKMSKTKGNLLRPLPIHQVMGSEALRYFLLREVSFGSDGNFSLDALVTRYNADLANGLGNLASRTLSMIQQYRNGVVPAAAGDEAIRDVATKAIAGYVYQFEEFGFSKGLEALWGLLGAADKFIVERAPWKLVKDPAQQALLDDTLYTAAEVVRIAAVLLAPVMPQAAQKIWSQLGYTTLVENERMPTLEWGQLPAGQQTTVTGGVFPRYELKPTVDKIMELEAVEQARQQAILGAKPAEKAPEGVRPPAEPPISIDDFGKVDLRVGQVLSAVKVKGADKLLHLSVDIGEEKPRSIVAGIALAYEPETLVGRKVVIVANLEPRKLRGLESQGMIVAASLENTKPVLAAFLEEVPIGARLK